MNTKEAKQSVQMDKALFDFYGKPSIGQSLPLAVQHVLAMIVGCVTPSIIVAGVAGLSQEDSVILIQAALVMSALTTLIQLFPFIKTKWFTIGAGLPVMMGISFAYVPSMQAIAADFDIATILGAQIVGGIIALLVGLNIKRIRKFFPPLITGTVVFSIGLSLYPTAINYMAGGASSENRVIYGDMTLGTLFLFASLMNYFISPVQNLIGLQPQLQEACIAMDRLNDILNATPEKNFHSGTLSPVDMCGTIHYDGVSFRYGYRKWVFQQVTFSINEGEHVALTGTNGSGKSTLAKLLVGMYEPDTGIITVGGQKISEIELECLRKHIIYVSQIPVLLSGTIREGLLFGCAHSINDELFERIAHGCGVDEIIRDNPFGYDWILTENGMNVSGGHRQRIAIARALLAEPDILILDEATSALDNESERWIQHSLEELSRNRTTITIAHRLSTIKNADEIIVLTENGIAERGTHETLLDKNGIYAAYYNMI